MSKAKIVLIIVIVLVIGGVLGFFAGRYIYSPNYAQLNSLTQFVLANPTTPWSADIQGVLTELKDSGISLQLRNKQGTSKEVYTLNLLPQNELIVDKVGAGSDTGLTTSKINYQDLKIGDEVVITVSSDGQAKSLIVSQITLIPVELLNR